MVSDIHHLCGVGNVAAFWNLHTLLKRGGYNDNEQQRVQLQGETSEGLPIPVYDFTVSNINWLENFTVSASVSKCGVDISDIKFLTEPFPIRTGNAVEFEDPFGNRFGITDYKK